MRVSHQLDLLHQLLDKDPSDQVIRMGLADLYEDLGDHEASSFYRWMATHAKYPDRRDKPIEWRVGYMNDYWFMYHTLPDTALSSYGEDGHDCFSVTPEKVRQVILAQYNQNWPACGETRRECEENLLDVWRWDRSVFVPAAYPLEAEGG